MQSVGDQLVVYDEVRRRLHVLSRTAAVVWRHCDGRHTVVELVEPVGNELGAPVDENLIALALAQLDEARLLDDRLAPVPNEHSLSRRELLHRTAAMLATSVLLPTVTSCGLPLEPTSLPGASLSFHETSTTTVATTNPPTTTVATTNAPTTTTSTTNAPTTTTSTTNAPTTTTSTTNPPTTTTTPVPTTTTTTTTQAPQRVAVCHNGRTIMVDQSAVDAHLAHGDTLGPCP